MQLAQLNIGRAAAPLDSEQLRDFMENLDPINALAEASRGFVWRLQTEDGNATAIKAWDDPLMILNMSVWESVESLADFVYRSAHTDFLRRRREFFEKPVEAIQVLWWVEDGHRPTVAEALARLDHLRAHGPTEHAFTFREARDTCPG
ncbi:MAG: hypothetical protein JWN67_2692 [Actinomycetia bacterium]|nr:hypothetical protein [Actinomycetes bacterium]